MRWLGRLQQRLGRIQQKQLDEYYDLGYANAKNECEDNQKRMKFLECYYFAHIEDCHKKQCKDCARVS